MKTGELDGIAEVPNDSAGQQTRLVIQLKRDANANVVLNNLYKHTPLQTSFGVNMLALVDGVPRTLNLAQALTHYVAHQVEVVTRRSRVPAAQGPGPGPHRRGPAQGHRHARRGHRHHPGLRRPPGRPRRRCMAEPFAFSEEQANHILDMTLGRLTRLGRTELEEEMAKLRETIAELEAILADPAKLRGGHRHRDDRDPGQVRQRPAQRDHPRPGRAGRRGPRSTTRRSWSP